MPRPRDTELLRALGSRLRQIRTDARWTQEALAEAVGIEPATLSRFERGLTGFSITTLGQIARTLDVKLAQLVDVDTPAPAAAPAPPPEGQPDEAELLRVWRSLDPTRRAMTVRVVAEIAKG